MFSAGDESVGRPQQLQLFRQPVPRSRCGESPVRRGRLLCDTIRDVAVTRAQKLTSLSFMYRTEPKNKKWKTEKLKSKNACSVLYIYNCAVMLSHFRKYADFRRRWYMEDSWRWKRKRSVWSSAGEECRHGRPGLVPRR